MFLHYSIVCVFCVFCLFDCSKSLFSLLLYSCVYFFCAFMEHSFLMKLIKGIYNNCIVIMPNTDCSHRR